MFLSIFGHTRKTTEQPTSMNRELSCQFQHSTVCWLMLNL